MASVADYLKLANTGYGVEGPDVGKVFSDAGRGMAAAQGLQDRRTLADVGLAASQGDMQGARNAAMAGGNVDLGMKMETHQREQVKNAMQQLKIVGSTAETQNDQQWQQSVQMFRQQGMNVPAAFEGPNGRLLAVAQSKSTMDKLQEELTRAQAGASNANAGLARAQTLTQPAESTARVNASNASAALNEAQSKAYGTESTARVNASNASAALNEAQRRLSGIQADTDQREFDNPSNKITIVPAGSTVLSTDRRANTTTPVFTGPNKHDATTMKEIQESDDFVAQGYSAISSLNKALELSKQAYSGLGAETRADIVNNTAGIVAARPNAIATGDLGNVVTNQALQSLRSTFGGNPTEGERKILLEVAGSVTQPATLRAQIYQRALVAAQDRLKFNQDKAAALRAGKYYQPGGEPPLPARFAARFAAAAGTELDEGRAAIARGASRDAVIGRLRKSGIDPAGL